MGSCVGRLHDDVILLFDQNPSWLYFLVQIRTFVENSLRLPNLNMNGTVKDSGRRSKMKPSTKWPILVAWWI